MARLSLMKATSHSIYSKESFIFVFFIDIIKNDHLTSILFSY